MRLMRLLAIALTLILTACGGSAMLIDQGGKQYAGKFDAISKTLEVTIDGKLYSGFYIVNSGYAVGSSQTFGARPTYGTTQFMVGGTSGNAMIRSIDGDAITCDFNYQGMRAIGVCVRPSSGSTYQLMAN